MKNLSPLLIAPALIMGGTLPALAQSDAQRIAALENRVAELENRDEPLSFGSSNTTVDVYGYIKADFIYDFGAELGNTTFGLVGLDGTQSGDFFNATVNQTRLGFRSTTPTSFGELGTQVEIDFYGAANAFSTGGAEPRLRHANITLNGWRIGKYWTTFMPLSSYPITLDFQGVAGIPFARQEMIQYTHEFGNNIVGQVALEENNGDSDDPVLIAALAYDTDPLLLRMSAIGGTVNDGLGGDEDMWGVNLSTTAQLWEGATLDASYTTGSALAPYLVFLGDSVDGAGDAIDTQAAYIGLAQEVGENWTFRGIYGWRDIDSGAAGDTENLESIHLNAQYQVAESTTLGVEYFHGTRDTFGGGSYDVDRIQTSIQFSF
ncbi:DcaP family trimeric outer membrane transporter [Palleronia pelagia]|uniref:Porin subfamily protein n=1 Tax=Palleronia pelagia TaxID=387096 RepID=A0A1H8AS11_9RHOB|nr:DcaP family trimeric outer membrane transporter [Palleronia pelagia]SEM72599.1 Porin subfamily protein [Palleronia pelagia]